MIPTVVDQIKLRKLLQASALEEATALMGQGALDLRSLAGNSLQINHWATLKDAQRQPVWESWPWLVAHQLPIDPTTIYHAWVLPALNHGRLDWAKWAMNQGAQLPKRPGELISTEALRSLSPGVMTVTMAGAVLDFLERQGHPLDRTASARASMLTVIQSFPLEADPYVEALLARGAVVTQPFPSGHRHPAGPHAFPPLTVLTCWADAMESCPARPGTRPSICQGWLALLQAAAPPPPTAVFSDWGDPDLGAQLQQLTEQFTRAQGRQVGLAQAPAGPPRPRWRA